MHNKEEFYQLSDDDKFKAYSILSASLTRSKGGGDCLKRQNCILIRRLESIRRQAEHGISHPWSIKNYVTNDKRGTQKKKTGRTK